MSITIVRREHEIIKSFNHASIGSDDGKTGTVKMLDTA